MTNKSEPHPLSPPLHKCGEGETRGKAKAELIKIGDDDISHEQRNFPTDETNEKQMAEDG